MAGVTLEDYLRRTRPVEDLVANDPLAKLIMGWQPSAPAPAPVTVPTPAPFKRGVLGAAANFTQAAGVAASYAGAFDFAKEAYDRAAQFAADRDAIPRRVGRVEDIQSLGDVGVFAYETLAENTPNLLALAIPAAGVGIGARVLGATAQGAGRAATAAAFLTDVGLVTGESAFTAQEAGGSPADIRVVGTGLGKAVLDFIPIVTLAKQFGLAKPLEKEIVKEVVQRGYLKRAAGNAATLIAQEIPTEVGQELLDISLKRTIESYSGSLTPEEKSQLLNAAAGAATFGLFGFVSGISSPKQRPPTEEAEAEVKPPLLLTHDGAIKTPEEKAPGPLLLTWDRERRLPSAEDSRPRPGEISPLDTPADQVDLFTRQTLGLKNAYDEKTGELKLPEESFKKILFEANRTIAYDPSSDGIVATAPPPAVPDVTKGWTQINPDVEVLDFRRGEKMGLNGLIQKQPDGTWAAILKDGSFAGQFVDPNEAKLAVKEFGTQPTEMLVFTSSGVERVASNTSPKLQRLIVTPPAERTPTENIEVEIEKQRQKPRTRRPEAATPRQRAPEIDSGLKTLMDERARLLADPTNIRTTDGQLKKNAETKVKAIETRINALSKKLGVNNPLGNGSTTTVEEMIATPPEKKPETYPNLSPTESALLDRLEEWDQIRGLSEREYEQLERLISKRRGEGDAPRVGAAATAIANMRAEREVKQALKEARKLRMLGQLRVQVQGVTRWVQNSGQWASKTIQQGLVDDGGNTIALISVTENGKFSAWSPGLGEIGTFDSALDARAEAVRRISRDILGGSSVAEVNAWVEKLWNSFPGVRIPLRIAQSAADITDFSQEQKERFIDARATGTYIPGKGIYLFADYIPNRVEAIKTLVHEVMHFGFSAILPEKDLVEFLRLVSRTRRKEISEFIQDYYHKEGGPDSLNSAEEYVAMLSEREINGVKLEAFEASLLDKVVALVLRALRRIIPNLRISDAEIRVMLASLGKALRSPNTEYNLQPNTVSSVNNFVMRVVPRAQREEIVEGISSFSSVWGARAKGLFLTPIQYAERAKSAAAQQYMQVIRQWWARKRTLADPALESASAWEKMGTKDAARLGEAILEIQTVSEQRGTRLSDVELVKIIRSHGLGETGFALYKQIDKNFLNVLDLVEKGIQKITLQQFAPEENHEKLLKMWREDRKAFLDWATEGLKDLTLPGKLADIEAQFAQARSTHYFPFMRFGKYALTVRGKEGEVIGFETFESYAGRDDRIKSIRADYPEAEKIEAGIVKDEEFALMGMPPAMIELIGEQIGLSKEQQFKLKELYIKKSPGQKFMRQFIKRRGIAGFSRDFVRVYSSYMTSAANHIARLEYQKPLQDQLAAMRREKGDAAGLVFNYFNEHYNYIMKPGNELAALRSIGFLFYLGFNVKSALVNLTQVPMIALPYLGARFGDTRAAGALTRAYGTALKWKRGEITSMDAGLVEAINRGISEGFLDESRATELAALGEAGVLERLGPATKSEQLLAKVSHYGAAMFRYAEMYNRAVTFIAARELALAEGMTSEQAFEQARRAVDTSMFEYAKWNRPTFMRGKKSVFFLFWNYMQHLSYLVFGGEGKQVALRVGLMLLIAAGIEGLPFAENILDIIDWSATNVKEALGLKDPKVDLRNELRELALTITDKPDLVMDGLGKYYGLGPLHALGLAGVPVPEVNISGSLSAGRIIPGLEQMIGEERDPNAKLGKTLVEMLGPVAGIGFGFFKALESNDPDVWKTWERAMPSAFKAASQAARRGLRGVETDRNGDAVLSFQWTNPEARGEILAQALGFQGTRLSQQYELVGIQQEMKQYWTARRAAVIENYAMALLSQEQEAIADARSALEKFNFQAPTPKLKVTGTSIKQSMVQRLRRRTLRENGIPTEKAFIPLYQNLNEIYSSETGTGNPGEPTP